MIATKIRTSSARFRHGKTRVVGAEVETLATSRVAVDPAAISPVAVDPAAVSAVAMCPGSIVTT